MVDLTPTIQAKSDQLNADDLVGIECKEITITAVSAGNNESPIDINFAGDGGKPFKPCKTMRRVLVSAWGADGTQYVGRMLRLYRDPDVKYAGVKVGGIRISHMSHIDKDFDIVLAETKKSKKPYHIKKLTVAVDAPEPTAEQKLAAATKKTQQIIEALKNGDSQEQHQVFIDRIRDGYPDLYKKLNDEIESFCKADESMEEVEII